MIDNFLCIKFKININELQIMHPTDGMHQFQHSAYLRGSDRPGWKSFSEHKTPLVLTNTQTPTQFHVVEKDASILHLRYPDVLVFFSSYLILLLRLRIGSSCSSCYARNTEWSSCALLMLLCLVRHLPIFQHMFCPFQNLVAGLICLLSNTHISAL